MNTPYPRDWLFTQISNIPFFKRANSHVSPYTLNKPHYMLPNKSCMFYYPLPPFFSSPDPGSGELLSPVSVRRLSSVVRPAVSFSHFNQLLWSHWANLNQTLVEWSLDCPLPKLCPVIPTSNQDGRQAKNRKRGDAILIVHCCFSIS